MGLMTVLGIARRGFFIPYRYAGALSLSEVRRRYEPMAALFAAHEAAFAEMLSLVGRYAPDLRAIGGEAAPAPRWAQDWFPRLDGAALYAMVRHHRPERIVEVGSGHSTRFAVRAATDAGIATDITAIDPAPRVTLAGLPVTLIRATVQGAGRAPFAALVAGDMLVIDSSHVLMPGSDVDLLLNHILPDLAPGVLVHLHDIFVPDPYPPEWEWRGYNEQQTVAALLQGGAWQPLFASHYVTRAMADQVSASVIAELPLPAGAYESSLWLRKREP
jgi:hypothetical protein